MLQRFARSTIALAIVVSFGIYLSGCGTSDAKVAGDLASAGKQVAATTSEYYGTLEQYIDRQPDLEILYRQINSLPELPSADVTVLEQQAKAIRRRKQLGADLTNVYGALEKLASYSAKKEVDAAVDSLTSSVEKINNEPPQIFGANAGDILKPLFNGVIEWKKSRSIRKSIVRIPSMLAAVKDLVRKEADVYNIIIDRHYTLIRGVRPAGTSGPAATTGIAAHLMRTHSASITYLLQQLPEIQEVPWNEEAVKDPVTKAAMERTLDQRLNVLEAKGKAASGQLAEAFQGLEEQHRNFVEKKPLTFGTLLEFRDEAQSYIDLLKKLFTRKSATQSN